MHKNIEEAFILKKCRLTNYERRIIEDFLSVYSEDSVFQAINHSERGDFKQVGFLLMQMAGFTRAVPLTLLDFLIGQSRAEEILPEVKARIADRIREAERVQDSTKILNTKIKDNQTIMTLWLQKNGEYPNEEEMVFLTNCIRRIGFDLPFRAVECSPLENQSTFPDKISFLREWLEISLQRDWFKMENLMERAGYNGYLPDSIPYPCPLRIERYFRAKTGRDMTCIEKSGFFSLSRKFSESDLIFFLSSHKSEEVTLEKVEWLCMTDDEKEYYETCGGTNPFTISVEQEVEVDETEEYEENYDDPDKFISFDDDSNEGYTNTVSDRNYDYSIFDEDSLDSAELTERYAKDEVTDEEY